MFIFSGCGPALLSCQVEQLKEELSQSQSEKEELRQRANELQQDAAAVREAPLCSRSRSFFFWSFSAPLPTAAAGYCLTRYPVWCDGTETVNCSHCDCKLLFSSTQILCRPAGQEVGRSLPAPSCPCSMSL